MNSDRRPAASPDKEGFLYEPVERFGESMTTAKPWNAKALQGVELLNGRSAMVGFAAVLLIELLSRDTFLHWAGLVP
jgi:hypothetical protein